MGGQAERRLSCAWLVGAGLAAAGLGFAGRDALPLPCDARPLEERGCTSSITELVDGSATVPLAASASLELSVARV